jgi:hypothetical protein
VLRGKNFLQKPGRSWIVYPAARPAQFASAENVDWRGFPGVLKRLNINRDSSVEGGFQRLRLWGTIARKAASNKALKKKSFTGRYESDILLASVAAVKDAAR